MERKERERMIALYRDGYRAVAEALHNATEEELGASPRRASGPRARSSTISPTAR